MEIDFFNDILDHARPFFDTPENFNWLPMIINNQPKEFWPKLAHKLYVDEKDESTLITNVHSHKFYRNGIKNYSYSCHVLTKDGDITPLHFFNEELQQKIMKETLIWIVQNWPENSVKKLIQDLKFIKE